MVYAWMALGLVVLGYFWFTDRDRIARTGAIFTEETMPADDGTQAAG